MIWHHDVDQKVFTRSLNSGVILIAVALLSTKFVKAVVLIGLAIFLLTNGRVQKLITEPEDKNNK